MKNKMPKIQISKETIRKIRAFKNVIDHLLGEEFQNESAYVELILYIGLEKMLQDPLPKEEMLLKTMVAMFQENPEFVSEFIVDTLKRGELIQKEKGEELKKMWRKLVV